MPGNPLLRGMGNRPTERHDRLGFPVKDGIPVMLEEDARKLPPEEEVA